MFYIVHLLSFIFLSHSFLQGPTLKRFQRHYNLEQYALPTNIVFKILDTIQYTTQDEWNSLLTPETSPFLNYEWICALEKSGCAVAEQGWQPLHLMFFYNETFVIDGVSVNKSIPLAACPLYLKYHSYGEYIFDQSWADYAQRALGIKYYPKILSAIPFTPATGQRVMIKPGLCEEDKEMLTMQMASTIRSIAYSNKLTSANVNFMLEEEVEQFLKVGYTLRETIQYRWHNCNPTTGEKFQSFDDYLDCFKSKRRIQIKRERKSVFEEQGIKIKTIRGDSDAATVDLFRQMFQIYSTTVEKMWGQKYLSETFFEMLAETSKDFRKNILLVLAYDKDEKLVAGTFNLISKTHFYGRHWGAFEFVKNLHFEACYYTAIDYCIKHGLTYMEPGAGGGSFKFLRGFDPYIVNSVHAFTSKELGNAVGDFLLQERRDNNISPSREVIDQAVVEQFDDSITMTSNDD